MTPKSLADRFPTKRHAVLIDLRGALFRRAAPVAMTLLLWAGLIEAVHVATLAI